uniref:Uncharacterized protein n=1 Tax=Tabanus bromius TaxID=304241 RepID=A0A0K8TQL7_TABBR
MGRTNRSRKRKDAMNRLKRERYAAKELQRLKKTLGLIDADGNEVMKEISEVATVLTAKEIKKNKKIKLSEEIVKEIKEETKKGEKVETVNEKTGKVHVYDTKTGRDQYGNFPPWHKGRKNPKRNVRLNISRKKNFKQAWTTTNIPL